MNGEIVWYSSEKRYGFVAPSDGGGDIVFRLAEDEAAALGVPVPGQAVHFLVAETPDGPVARRLAAGHAPPA